MTNFTKILSKIQLNMTKCFYGTPDPTTSSPGCPILPVASDDIQPRLVRDFSVVGTVDTCYQTYRDAMLSQRVPTSSFVCLEVVRPLRPPLKLKYHLHRGDIPCVMGERGCYRRRRGNMPNAGIPQHLRNRTYLNESADGISSLITLTVPPGTSVTTLEAGAGGIYQHP